MRAVDIIRKKRDGGELTPEELQFFVEGITSGTIPDYQASALMMAIFFRGMLPRETAALTMQMKNSGDTVDLSGIEGLTVDKHSTGGVGDKTTLVAAPIAAACGVRVAKMSGRGLGHTGGTVDKLEAIPGFRTTLSADEFFDVVNKTGMCLVGQSGNLAPADKILYALRDVTATVESIPLIAASIMSKKLAAGSECILLDVKVGNGAFMSSREDALLLAKAMVEIGNSCGKKTAAMLTDMDTPLGTAIGNGIEVAEAAETLRGKGEKRFTRLCLSVAAGMLRVAGLGDGESCLKLAEEALYGGRALECLKKTVTAQGGNSNYIDDCSLFPRARFSAELVSKGSGYITSMNAHAFGEAACLLGAGRTKKGDSVSMTAGILLNAKTGNKVEKGGSVATLLTDDKSKLDGALEALEGSFSLGDTCPDEKPIIIEEIFDIN